MTERQIELINVRQFLISIQNFESIQEKTRNLFNELHSQCFKNSPAFFDSIINMAQQYDTFLLLFSEKTGPRVIDYKIIFMLQIHSKNFNGHNLNIITDVCTLKSERKQGIAEQCFGYLLNEKNLEFINIPTILWVDRRTKYWQNAFKLYEKLGFRKFTDEENEFFKDFGLDQRYITYLKYQPSTTVIQQIQQSKQITYYKKLFIDYDVFTNLFVTKFKYFLAQIEYGAFSEKVYITKDKKHIFVKNIEIVRQIDEKPKNLVGICFGLKDETLKNFLTVLFANRKDFTLLIINIHIIEIYWIKTKIQIDVDYIIQSIMEFGISNVNELIPLYAPNSEIFALLRANEIIMFDQTNQTGITFNNLRPGLPSDIRRAVAFGQPLSSTDRALVLIDESFSFEHKISSLSINPYLNLIPSSSFLNIKNTPKLLNSEVFIDKFQKYQQNFQQQQRQQQQLGQQQRKQGQQQTKQGQRMQQDGQQRQQQGQQRQKQGQQQQRQQQGQQQDMQL